MPHDIWSVRRLGVVLWVVLCTGAAAHAAPGTPVLTLTAECNGTASIRLNWTTASGATSYDMYRNGAVYQTGLTGTQFINTAITPGTSYSYFIRARNSSGFTNSSTKSATAPICSTPGVPVLTLAAECSGTTTQIRLNWTTSSGATSYDMYRNGSVYQTGLTGTQFINTAVTPGTAYNYFIVARNSSGSTSSLTKSATAPNCAVLGVPALTLTAECSGTTSQIRLNWTTASGATSYDLYRNGVAYQTGLTGTQFINTAVTAGTAYSYFIVARNSSSSTSSSTKSATAPNCSAPGTPVLTLTAECSGTTSQIRLNWTAASGATTYDMFRNGAVYQTGLTGTQFINTAVTPGATYSYFILARNSNGSTSSLTKSAAAPGCIKPGVVSVGPSSGEAGTLISYQGTGFTKDLTVTIHIRRPSGSELATRLISTTGAGQFSGTIQTTGFSAGTYQVWAVDNGSGVSSNLAQFALSTPANPSLIGSSLSVSTASAGDAVRFSYTISNPASTSRNIVLGASLQASDSNVVIADAVNSRAVSVPPGTSTQSRVFQIPQTAASGLYEATWTLWNQAPGSPAGLIKYDEAGRSRVLTVNAIALNPVLEAVSVSSTTASAGDVITLSYTINNPSLAPTGVFLAASIRSTRSGIGQEDPQNNSTVSLPTGRNVKTRSFRIASNATELLYDIIWTIWNRDPSTGSAIRLGQVLYPRFLTLLTARKLEASIVAPLDGSTFNSDTLQMTANVSSNVGTSIALVEFIAIFDGVPHVVGTATAAPYTISWRVPSALRHQLITLRVNVVDSLKNTGESLPTRVTYNDPAVTEKYVPKERLVYINQRALDPRSGGRMCSVASGTMALAMNGLVDSDFIEMQQTAKEMWDHIQRHGGPGPYTLTAALRNQVPAGVTVTNIVYNYVDGWEHIKSEIDDGRPVIVRTMGVTEDGHYVVAVGYREKGTEWDLKVNDPVGKWYQTPYSYLQEPEPKNYDRNTDDQTSAVGRFRDYNFAKIFLGGNVSETNHLISVIPPAGSQRLFTVSSAASENGDAVSEETGVPAIYDGQSVISASFSDPDLVAGVTPIRAAHIVELRGYVDLLRNRYGLPAYSWTDPQLIAGGTPLRAIHIIELRAALRDAYIAAGATPPTYTDPALANTFVRTVHLTELRAAVALLY